jgi:hypothetical protein
MNKEKYTWKKIGEETKIIKKNSINNEHLKARIHGYICGDGSIFIRNKNNREVGHLIKFYPDDLSMMNSFIKAMKIIYEKEPKIKKLKGYYSVIYYSKSITKDLLKHGPYGTKLWGLPKKLLVSKEAKKEWLKALFDSEAYVGKDHIKIQTVNPEGMKDVKSLLQKSNIYTREYQYSPKNPNWSKVYIIRISRLANLKTYQEKIGFTHSQKNLKLKKLISSKNR